MFSKIQASDRSVLLHFLVSKVERKNAFCKNCKTVDAKKKNK